MDELLVMVNEVRILQVFLLIVVREFVLMVENFFGLEVFDFWWFFFSFDYFSDFSLFFSLIEKLNNFILKPLILKF